jgi:hypothetical protein
MSRRRPRRSASPQRRLRTGTEDLIATYLAGDVTGAWKKFFAQADITMLEPVIEQMVGGERDPQQMADERRWFAHEMRASTYWQPDPATLRAGTTASWWASATTPPDSSATEPPARSLSCWAPSRPRSPAADIFATHLRTVIRES